MVISLFSIYKTRKNRRYEHPVTEKTLDFSKKGRVISQVSEVLPPSYLKTKRASAKSSWRPHTHFEFPGKAPPRGSLRISHPYPIPTNDAVESITLPAIQRSPSLSSIASHSRQWGNESTNSRTSPKSPRKSLSNSIPVGRTSNVSAAQHPYQQHIAKGSASKLPTRPESKPAMPPAAFWRYAIEKQSIDVSPGILQKWQLESDRWSLPSSIGRSSPIPTPSTKAVTLDGRVKRRSDRAKKKRSLESLERRTFHRQMEGSSTECIDGITWEIAGGRPVTQDRENKRHSRKLVKKRRSSG